MGKKRCSSSQEDGSSVRTSPKRESADSPSAPSGAVVFAMATEVIAQRDYPTATKLLEAALSIEDASGRGRDRLALQILRATARVGLMNSSWWIAKNCAKRLLSTAPDSANRRAARRLLAQVERAQDAVVSRGSQVGGHAIFDPKPVRSNLTFSDVGGMERVKREISHAGILPLEAPEMAKRYGVSSGGAILLYGPPGCGKTLIAEAAAGEMGALLFVVKSADIMHPLMGMDERNLAAVFEAVREQAKSVLFFDELDAMTPVRGLSTVEARRCLVNAFLTEMDGAVTNEGCLIIGATNAPELIDPALKRRGRFDKLVYVGPPDSVAREAIFGVKLANKPIAEDVDVPLLAELSHGLTGADIDGVVRDAVEAVWVQSGTEGTQREVGMLDLLAALSRSTVDGKARSRIDGEISERWLRSLERHAQS